MTILLLTIDDSIDTLTYLCSILFWSKLKWWCDDCSTFICRWAAPSVIVSLLRNIVWYIVTYWKKYSVTCNLVLPKLAILAGGYVALLAVMRSFNVPVTDLQYSKRNFYDCTAMALSGQSLCVFILTNCVVVTIFLCVLLWWLEASVFCVCHCGIQWYFILWWYSVIWWPVINKW